MKTNTKHIDFDKIVKIVDSGVNENGNVWIEFKTLDDNGCNTEQKTQTRDRKDSRAGKTGKSK